MTGQRRPARTRRSGAGALLGISALGVVVLSIMLLSQGYLSGALTQADAVATGRRAELLADAAIAEARYLLQAGRNGAYNGLFVGGGSASITPAQTQGLATDGISVGAVSVTVTEATGLGLGRGARGTVDLTVAVSVPRRVAALAGAGSTRTVRHRYEFVAVQQGPPAPYANWPLYATRLEDLPDVRDWYDAQVVEYFEGVRDDTAAAVREDADRLAGRIDNLAAFVRYALGVIDQIENWPSTIPSNGNLSDGVYLLSGSGQSWGFSPPLAGSARIGVGPLAVTDNFTVPRARVRLRSIGEVEVAGVSRGSENGWRDSAEIPPVLPLIETDVAEALERRIERAFPGMTAAVTRARLAQMAARSGAQFIAASGTDPVQFTTNDFPEFRPDGKALTLAAHFEGTVNSDDIRVHVPTGLPTVPVSPLANIDQFEEYPLVDLSGGSSSGELVAWIDHFIASWPEYTRPFLDYPGQFEPVYQAWIQAWTDEVERLQALILLDPPADETEVQAAYWDAMAAYEFPDAATMTSYIADRWGTAGAVYRFPGGDLDLSALPGHATFVSSAGFSVRGASDGRKNVVSGGTLVVEGATEGALISAAQPIDFQGGPRIRGTVMTRGIRNDGDRLQDFEIEHVDMSDAPITVSVCEYPTQVVVDRGVE